MAILVTGGAGYIGSVTAAELLSRGEEVVILDNLSRGYRNAVPRGAEFLCGDIGDREIVRQLLNHFRIDAVMHFSAFAYVGESVAEPMKYYLNNVVNTVILLDTIIAAGVRKFIFSSTCATYGEPEYLPIDESHPQKPTNPYGQSKHAIERVLSDLSQAQLIEFVSLRYFNACGATVEYGEFHQPETHLIPIVLEAAAGKRTAVPVFGTDYDTPDGTAIRDYIHVSDLAAAHIAALDYLAGGGNSQFINLGNGTGYSVLEVIRAASEVTGRPINVEYKPRRSGDPSRLVANASKAAELLGWQPKISSLEKMIGSAYRWHQKYPNGYLSR
ncbi:MAG: UDP-glucose 4-epimerase GalE [Blastocatellia bacterium]